MPVLTGKGRKKKQGESYLLYPVISELESEGIFRFGTQVNYVHSHSSGALYPVPYLYDYVSLQLLSLLVVVVLGRRRGAVRNTKGLGGHLTH